MTSTTATRTAPSQSRGNAQAGLRAAARELEALALTLREYAEADERQIAEHGDGFAIASSSKARFNQVAQQAVRDMARTNELLIDSVSEASNAGGEEF